MADIDPNVPQENVDVEKAPIRVNFGAIAARIGTMPDVWGSIDAGELIAVNDSQSGPTTASLGQTPISGAGRELVRVKPRRVPISANTPLKGATHLGMMLKSKTTSAVTLQLELNADPTLGVQDGFNCSFLRPETAGALMVSSSTLQNGRSDGYAKVSAGGMALLYVDAEDGKFYLSGAVEA